MYYMIQPFANLHLSIPRLARSLPHLCKRQEQLKKSWVVWSTKTSKRIPALSSEETISTAARVATYGDIVEDTWVGVEGWVNKANGLLSSLDSLFVDSGQDGSEDWG